MFKPIVYRISEYGINELYYINKCHLMTKLLTLGHIIGSNNQKKIHAKEKTLYNICYIKNFHTFAFVL